jgi:hypothetical protein
MDYLIKHPLDDDLEEKRKVPGEIKLPMWASILLITPTTLVILLIGLHILKG